jgi:hypothetical protein
MATERKKMRNIRVYASDDIVAALRTAKAATGLVSDSEVVRMAIKELADRVGKRAA